MPFQRIAHPLRASWIPQNPPILEFFSRAKQWRKTNGPCASEGRGPSHAPLSVGFWPLDASHTRNGLVKKMTFFLPPEKPGKSPFFCGSRGYAQFFPQNLAHLDWALIDMMWIYTRLWKRTELHTPSVIQKPLIWGLRNCFLRSGLSDRKSLSLFNLNILLLTNPH